MKKNLNIIIGVICIVSVLCSGYLFTQYTAQKEKANHLTGTISYSVERDMWNISDVAYMYQWYLEKIVSGECTLDDLFHYAQGATERDTWQQELYGIHFDNMTNDERNQLMDLMNDCYEIFYIHVDKKKDVIAQLADVQLEELAENYGKIEQLMSGNKKGVAYYFAEKDYTSADSLQKQAELRETISAIDNILHRNIDMIEKPMQESVASEKAQFMQIEGYFVAKVREVLPDYVLDDVTPRKAVVTMFQDGPFIISVGEAAADLEIGKIYAFEIKPKQIEMLEENELSTADLYPEKSIPYYGLQIANFYEVESDLYSEEPMQLKCVPVKWKLDYCRQ